MSFNNGPRTVTTGLSLLVDAADPLSYPGSGTSWTDIVTGITGSLSGSITYASDFKGALVVNDSSSVIIFPTSSGNFGTDSFTVELAFQPNQINGQHWLISKNSGSLPSWGAFITGSGGSGRVTAFFNASSTVSCSMSTPTGSIVTGSNYLVDINFSPNTILNTLYLNSELSGSVIANGSGSLTATSSLFISNRNSGSSVGVPLEIFNAKLYTPKLVAGRIRQNYNSLSTRLGLPQKTFLSIVEDQLLNLYPGAAAAYSLRLLNSDYAGSAIRVRRSSDNAEQDIGFDRDGNLNTGALLAFCGAANGFVTTWYDQSGNARNATQSTAANQPKVVNAGSVLIDANGKPRIQSVPNSSNLKANFTLNQPISVFGVVNYTSLSSPSVSPYAVDLKSLSGNIVAIGASSSKARIFAGANLVNSLTLSQNTTYLSYGLLNGVNSSVAINTTITDGNAGTDGSDGITLFNSQDVGSAPLNGYLSEVIIYGSNQSSNRDGISTNINTYYGIY